MTGLRKWIAASGRALCLDLADMALRDGRKRDMIQWAKRARDVRAWGNGFRTVTVQRGNQTVKEWV